MPRYSAFLALDNGDYREVDELIEAPDSRTAAQRLIASDVIEPGDDFPVILIVEELAISVFTCDRLGRVVTPAQHVRKEVDDERGRPPLRLLRRDDPDASG